MRTKYMIYILIGLVFLFIAGVIWVEKILDNNCPVCGEKLIEWDKNPKNDHCDNCGYYRKLDL